MKEKIKVLYANKSLRLGLYIVGALFILCVVFQAGLFVGYHKANFAGNWGKNYERNFGIDRSDSFGGMMFGRLPTSRGSSGKVLSVNLPNFVIADRDGVEKNILITDKTIIRNGLENSSSTSIKSDDEVVVLGEPNNQGQIEAKLIRVMSADFATSTNMYNNMYNVMFRR